MKVGIAGAGIMGRLLAFYLVNAGCQVTLFDQNQTDDEDNCSMAAAGLLTPFSELTKSDPIIFDMSVAALNLYWPTILKEIGANHLLKKSGSLIFTYPENAAELEWLDRFKQYYHLDYPGQKIQAAEISELEPELTKFQNAYYISQEAYLDNQNLLKNLKSYLHKQKINWYHHTWVKRVEQRIIYTEDTEYFFDLVCDCRGLGAKDIFPNLRGVRGELLWVQAPEVNISRPIRLLTPRYNLYVVPRPDHAYILGASEIESEHRKPVSVRTTLELLSGAYFLHPGFSEASILKMVQHCRPTLNSARPQIKFQPGFVALNGLYRHGFSLAPIMAAEVLSWIESGFSQLKYPQLWSLLV